MADTRHLVNVTVAYCAGPQTCHEWHVSLPAGSALRDALEACRLQATFPPVGSIEDLRCGVWGRPARPEQVLRERDRVEIYRPLKVDPKVARRKRFRRQGSRAAGLFAQTSGPSH